MEDRITQYEIDEESAAEAMSRLVNTQEGVSLLRHIFTFCRVGRFPPDYLEGEAFQRDIGRLSLGNQLFALLSKKNPDAAASILTSIYKEDNDVKE